ncbi:Lipoyltransferase 1, mitochondrial [Halotydeus destructor]|nr:Lipoyltransferase 1, mitochondrial [Halotydeus destructor]
MRLLLNFCSKIQRRQICSVSHEYLREPAQSFVLRSESRDIFTNLALEDWLYTNAKLAAGVHGFFLWYNEPCIVIGRHQNPWTEVNVSQCERNNIKVVRRNSGGGTVYHDLGNLNLCFLTTKAEYCRKRNLQFISNVLSSKFGIASEITKREDLVLSDTGEKISGTASKLSSKNAYHHCTLLVNVDLNNLHGSLRKNKQDNIESKATESIKSPVKNLTLLNSSITMESLITSLVEAYTEHFNVDEPFDVSPDDESFPGLGETQAMLKSWEWIYGKTPRFFLKTSAKLKDEITKYF